MFLKYLTISNSHGLIRHIPFRMGLNIITNAPTDQATDTGNNVGKTTLLQLIDFCLGGDSKRLFVSGRKINHPVQRFAISTQLKATLCLTEDLGIENSGLHIITRQFTPEGRTINTIDNIQTTNEQFQLVLQQCLWQRTHDTPSFRQIISHSIRISPSRQESSLYTLEQGTEEQYQSYLLYLFGANPDDSQSHDRLKRAIRADTAFRTSLMRGTSAAALQSDIQQARLRIQEIESQKNNLQVSAQFEDDLTQLSTIKQQIAETGVELNNLQLRESLIQESLQSIQQTTLNMPYSDQHSVKDIYQQAKALCPELQRTYDELVQFHLQVNLSRHNFICQELATIQKSIRSVERRLSTLRKQESELVSQLNHSISFQDYTRIIAQLNQAHEHLGQLLQLHNQLRSVNERIATNQSLLNDLTRNLFSPATQQHLQLQLSTFNRHFRQLSQHLYGEDFEISAQVAMGKSNTQHYQFESTYPDNHSTGKRQGEITCFDLAYIPFADEESIPCLHFILNDQRELLDANQLTRAALWAERQPNVQYVVAILRSKLPEELQDDTFIVLTLSQSDRLLRIENRPE